MLAVVHILTQIQIDAVTGAPIDSAEKLAPAYLEGKLKRKKVFATTK